MNSKRTALSPVDPTRRRFLSTAAGLAAAGTVVALAAKPERAAAGPMTVDNAAEYCPSLKAPARALADAHGALEASRARFREAEQEVWEWSRDNPRPRRGITKWRMAARAARDRSGFSEALDQKNAAWGSYRAAQLDVARFIPENIYELGLKGSLAIVYEDLRDSCDHALIARSIAHDAVRLTGWLS